MRFRSLRRAVPDEGGDSDAEPHGFAGNAGDAGLALLFESQLREHWRLFGCLAALQGEVGAAALLMAHTLQRGGRLFVFGNGVSASDSQNLAAELSGRLRDVRRPLVACALSGQGTALMCLAPHEDYSDVFARQLALVARPGDCAVGLSISGRSPNVLRAFEAARGLSLSTVGLLGGDGVHSCGMVDRAVVVPHADGARVREVHVFVAQTWCRQIEGLLQVD